jgi:hypothetical protein
MNAKEEIKNLKRSIELQFGLKRNGDADALAMMNWYKRLSQIESAIFDVPSFFETVEGALKESVEIKNADFKTYYTVGFGDDCNFILNYKKAEL